MTQSTLGDTIEAFRGDLLFVVDVTTTDKEAAYLIEGPPRSHSEDAAHITVSAATIDAATSDTEIRCPQPPTSLSELEYLPPFVRALCFERQLTLEHVWVDWLPEGDRQGRPPNGFLSGYAEPGSGTLPFSVAPGVNVGGRGWLTVTGRFGQAHDACGDEFGVLRCQERFLIEDVRPGETPFSVLSGSWSRMSAAPIAGRWSYIALPTAQEMFIWGGDGYAGNGTSGAIYDPEADRWTEIARAPGKGRVAAAAGWSGREVIIWGGWWGTRVVADGIAYDARRDRWSKIPTAPIKPGGGVGAWSGDEFVVVSSRAQAAAWNPVSRAWRRLPDPPIPEGHIEGVWTGRELIVLGIGEGTREPVVGAALDVSTSTWRTIADVPYDGLILGIKPVWTDERMLFVGHEYDPAKDEWRVLRRDGCIYSSVSDGVWTGSFVINQTQAFDLDRRRCYTLPRSPERPGFEGVLSHEFHTPVWADGRLVVWSGGTGLDGPAPPPDGIVFTPSE